MMDYQPDEAMRCEECGSSVLEDGQRVCDDCMAEIVRDFQQARETDRRIDEYKERDL